MSSACAPSASSLAGRTFGVREDIEMDVLTVYVLIFDVFDEPEDLDMDSEVLACAESDGPAQMDSKVFAVAVALATHQDSCDVIGLGTFIEFIGGPHFRRP